MTPLFHDLRGETVLVFGGGSVGARKARRFATESRVVVVSPRFHESLVATATGDVSTESVGPRESLGQSESAGPSESTASTRSGRQDALELVRASPDPEDVREWIARASPALAVAATNDSAVNAAIEAEAHAADVLVNRTDRSGERDPRSVVVPATVEDGPVRVAISTGARSPALSKALRERIEAEIEGAGAMADLSGALREELHERGVDPDERRAAIRAVVRSEPVWKALQEGGSKGRKEAEKVIEEVIHG